MPLFGELQSFILLLLQPQQYAYAISVPTDQQIHTGMMADPGMMQGNTTGTSIHDYNLTIELRIFSRSTMKLNI